MKHVHKWGRRQVWFGVEVAVRRCEAGSCDAITNEKAVYFPDGRKARLSSEIRRQFRTKLTLQSSSCEVTDMQPTPKVRAEMFFRRHMSKIGLTTAAKTRLIAALARDFKDADPGAGEARRALEIIEGLGPLDPATNAAKIGQDALGIAVTALGKLREADKKNCLHGGVFRGEKCAACGQDVR